MRYALLIAPLLFLAGCRHDQPVEPEPVVPLTGVLKLTVRPTWNGADFDKTNVYLSAAEERVLIQMVKFYLSPIELIGDTEVVASAAELMDITNGAQQRWMKIPVGTYNSLKFGLGVPYGLNHADITDIDPTLPLGSGQGMYWTWATMYRFMIFDGRYDTDPDATGTPPYQFSLHTGRDECYRDRVIPAPFAVSDGDTTGLVLAVDIARFFTDGDLVLDLSQGPQSHGEAQNLAPALRLSDLAVKAINAD